MQAINHDKNDLDAKWDKAVLHSEIDEPRKVRGCVVRSRYACQTFA